MPKIRDYQGELVGQPLSGRVGHARVPDRTTVGRRHFRLLVSGGEWVVGWESRESREANDSGSGEMHTYLNP